MAKVFQLKIEKRQIFKYSIQEYIYLSTCAQATNLLFTLAQIIHVLSYYARI